MQNTGILSIASQQAKWLELRQQTIAQNIAHANIPGYVSKDVKPFKAVLDRTEIKLALTDPKHVRSTFPNGRSTGEIDTSLKMNQYGSVDIETELMKTTEIRTGYELNTAIVNAFNQMILTATKS